MRSSLTAWAGRLAAQRVLAWALAVAMIVLAVVLGWQTHRLNNDAAVTNRAMLDLNRQTSVVNAVTQGLSAVLSYSYTDPAATTKAANAALSKEAHKQFDTLYASLQERAPGQQLTLSATVQVIGVQRLSRDDAVLLVFVDQSSTRAKDDERTVSAAQLRITAERRAQTWVITSLTPL